MDVPVPIVTLPPTTSSFHPLMPRFDSNGYNGGAAGTLTQTIHCFVPSMRMIFLRTEATRATSAIFGKMD